MTHPRISPVGGGQRATWIWDDFSQEPKGKRNLGGRVRLPASRAFCHGEDDRPRQAIARLSNLTSGKDVADDYL